MRSVVVLWLAVWVAGCSAAGQAAIESVGTLASSFGSAATGYQTAQSTKKLNEANVQVALANAAFTRQQASDLNTRQHQVEHERPVVVRILNSAADSERDPMLQSVALWVAAGGDPDYAFKYWLSHEEALSAGPNSHPTLELPNQQPALQPKLAEAQPNQSELIPKQAPPTSASESPQASSARTAPPPAPSSAQLLAVAPGR
jgi:hypothetical protein